MREVLRDPVLRKRVVLMLSCEFLWGIGTFFVLPSTTLPVFLTAHGASPLVIGTMATAMGALPLLCQLLGRQIIERFPHRKTGLILMHGPIIAPYFVVAALEWLLKGHPALMVVLAILLLAVSQVAMGMVIPLWLDMVSRVVPSTFRGRYFGFSMGAYALGGILGGTALAALERSLGRDVFVAAFVCAGTFFAAAMAAFAAAPVPESAFYHESVPPLGVRLKRSLGACRLDSDFGKLVWSYAAVSFAAGIIPFLVVYAIDARNGLGYPPGVFGRITFLQALGGGVGSVFLGWMVDHHGPRWPWVAATLVVPTVTVLVVHGAIWPVLAACSLLAGVLLAHWSVSAPALLEFSPEGDKSSYVAIANLIGFVPATVGPLLFGGLIQGWGYSAAFAAAGLIGLLALFPALGLRRRSVSATPAMSA
jgi:MFS family permease